MNLLHNLKSLLTAWIHASKKIEVHLLLQWAMKNLIWAETVNPWTTSILIAQGSSNVQN